jgi:hypothetical protein
LRLEPVGEQVRAGERLFRHHHPVAHRLAAATDLLPDPIAGREAPISVVKRGVDAVGAEVAELMRPHVLHSEAHAGGVGEARNFRQRKIPLAVVGNSLVDEANKMIFKVNHSSIAASPMGKLLRNDAKTYVGPVSPGAGDLWMKPSRRIPSIIALS